MPVALLRLDRVRVMACGEGVDVVDQAHFVDHYLDPWLGRRLPRATLVVSENDNGCHSRIRRQQQAPDIAQQTHRDRGCALDGKYRCDGGLSQFVGNF